jgi:hypothetical protein
VDIAFEKLRARQDPAADIFEIISEQGEVLIVVPFSEVLQPRHSENGPLHRVIRKLIITRASTSCGCTLLKSKTCLRAT